VYLDKFKINGERAVVTGGGRGIGLACVHALCEAGARVSILEVEEKLAMQGVDTMDARGFKVDAHICDVSDSQRIADIADTIAAEGKPASILVNNAGIALSDVPAEDMDDARWLKVIDVNLNGTYWCC
jgi:NAD(P)-dependent dehydrogenase (short-subunit alcohol dehydrogenase family)